ncbi:MAG: hypothetical protein RLN90_14455 [Balneolaceae bacterium]
MKTNEKITQVLKSQSLKIIILSFLICFTTVSCQDDDIGSPSLIMLKTVSANEISMDGIWSSGCVEANNNMILNESLSFNNENLQIDIKGYNNLQCNGATVFSQAVIITFNNSGTTTFQFNGNQVIVNKIDGTATYDDGRVEAFKQVFFIDDTGNNLYMHHALFGNDGGEVDAEGYPIEIIPIPITKTTLKRRY